ncbi:heme ABC transporter ATP-binding protein [Micromonospora sp. WMMD1082]|uniref:heme ABC transporter ATP-binding protein n=1 Tax=Micromonospora sp. WMMD1082 TaxID=3016104 RepID=UPI00241809A0|nr:heme ABC transporter ATP-binding protein [Micromonospora sp. WMMD1082]MDG4792756.1 heme ABC transporter ATP-binding protein [Micromonospora sp. WMMD1082]
MTIIDALWRRPARVPASPPEGTVLIEARGVSLSLGGAPVLREVDLALRAGEVLAVVGPNGAGKSTLLGVLAGDHQPESGTVAVGGAPLHSWSATELAFRRGVLLQRVEVSFPFTVTQVVRMGRAPWAGTPAEDWDEEVIATALAETDVAGLADRVYTSLSGGERARAALARVLAQEPVALLLDEPTASLDIGHQERILGMARQRAARGDAVLLVLHDLGLAAAYADRVAVLSAGRVVAVGPPTDVLTAERLTEVYQYPIEVLRHPRTGAVLVIPQRDGPGDGPGTANLPDLAATDTAVASTT